MLLRFVSNDYKLALVVRLMKLLPKPLQTIGVAISQETFYVLGERVCQFFSGMRSQLFDMSSTSVDVF